MMPMMLGSLGSCGAGVEDIENDLVGENGLSAPHAPMRCSDAARLPRPATAIVLTNLRPKLGAMGVKQNTVDHVIARGFPPLWLFFRGYHMKNVGNLPVLISSISIPAVCDNRFSFLLRLFADGVLPPKASLPESPFGPGARMG
jgi:hypothetical protein